MVVESIDADDLRRILEDNSTSPRVVPGTAIASTRPISGDASEATGANSVQSSEGTREG